MAQDKPDERCSELAGRLLAMQVLIGVVLKHHPWRGAILTDALAVLDQIKPGALDLLPDKDEVVLAAARQSLKLLADG